MNFNVFKVDAFRSKSAHETGSKMAENPFSFTPLEAEVSAISVQNGCDATGSAALDIVLEMNGEAEVCLQYARFIILFRIDFARISRENFNFFFNF